MPSAKCPRTIEQDSRSQYQSWKRIEEFHKIASIYHPTPSHIIPSIDRMPSLLYITSQIHPANPFHHHAKRRRSITVQVDRMPVTKDQHILSNQSNPLPWACLSLSMTSTYPVFGCTYTSTMELFSNVVTATLSGPSILPSQSPPQKIISYCASRYSTGPVYPVAL